MADIQDRFPQTAVAAHAGSPAVSASFVTTSALIGVYLAIGAVLLAFADQAGPELPGFNALFAGGVFVTEGVTCFLLMVVYRRQPRRSVLLLVAAYMFSALMSVGYLLAYPGAIAPGRPLMGTPQSIAWIYNSWIVGFASLTFAAVLVEVVYGARLAPDRKARLLAAILPTLATIAAVLLIVLAIAAGHQLPLLASGAAWTSLNAIFSSTAAILLAGSVALILFALRPPRELFLWLSLALAAIAIGNALSVFGGGRYTVGWYACRLSWLISSGVLLLYFLGQFVRQEGQLTRAADDLEERTRERDRIWSVSEDLLGVATFDGDFVSVNPAWEKVLGWSEAEVKGLQIDGLRHPDDAAHSLQARRRLAEGVPTGISAADRARTVQVAVARGSQASDLVQPGHIFPLQAVDGGVLMRAGHTEAGCDLSAMAGCSPAAVICEIMKDDGTMARLPDLQIFAAEHGIKIGTIADLIEHRSRTESLVEKMGQRTLHTAYGEFTAHAFRDKPSRAVHLALVKGQWGADHVVPVRVHEPLSVLDALEVNRSMHSWGLDTSLHYIAAQGQGVAVLLNCGESAAQLLEQFEGTARAAQAPERGRMDLRTYGVGAQILREVGVAKMQLMGQPRRMPSMAGYGLEITGYIPKE